MSTFKKQTVLLLMGFFMGSGVSFASGYIQTDTTKKDTAKLLNKISYNPNAATTVSTNVQPAPTKSSKKAIAQTQSVTSTGTVVAGRTTASLDVSPSGAATYTVPIAAPPGIDGVTPKIALAYNSQSGNGLAGYGWNISGISRITRVPATKYHDNVIGIVNVDLNDKYALDGQRLVLKSGTYGADGSEYQTEGYSNIRIIARGTSSINNGPNTFDVYYPDGSHAVYGERYGSRSPTDFAVDYIDNPQGIRINFTYTPDNNTLYIASITYGAKGAGTPINTINFIYKERQRKEQAYAGTYNLYQSKILSEINVIANGVNYRNYVLTHDQIPGLNYERVKTIQELNGDRSKNFDPIVFDYANTSATITETQFNTLPASGFDTGTAKVINGDFDGNGKMDMIIYPTTLSTINRTPYLYLNPKDGLKATQAMQLPPEIFEDIFTVNTLDANNTTHATQNWVMIKQLSNSAIDFEIHGRNDYSNSVLLDNKHWVNVPTAPDYYSECTQTTKPGNKVPREYLSGDFNGDGLTDLIAINKPYNYTYREFLNDYHEDHITTCDPILETENTSTAYYINLDRRVSTNFVNLAGTLLKSYSGSDKLYTADVNGDGRTDIIQISPGVMYVYSLNGENALVLLCQKNDSRITTAYPPLIGDFNGDGKSDVIFPTGYDTMWFSFFLSTGFDFVKIEQNLPFANSSNTDYIDNGNDYRTVHTITANDINADGKTDLILTHTITNATRNNARVTVTSYNNIGSSSVTGAPNFTQSGQWDSSGLHLAYNPIHVFLTNQPNFNLEYGLISDDALMLFSHQKDLRTDAVVQSVYQDGVTQYIDYTTFAPTFAYYQPHMQTYPYVDIESAPGLKLVTKLRRDFDDEEIMQTFGYNGPVANTEGLGFLGFNQTSRSSWMTGESDPNRVYNITINDPLLRGAVLRTFTAKSNYLTDAIKNLPATQPDITLSAPVTTAQTVTASNSVTLSNGFTANGNNGVFIANVDNPATGVNDGGTLTDYITRTDYTYNTQLLSNKVFINVPTSVKTKDLLSNTNTLVTYQYDSYYNITNEFSNFSGIGTKTVQSTFENNPTGNYYGRLLTQKTILSNGGDTFSNEEQYTYTGFLPTQIKRKGNGTPFITDDIGYDIYGNVINKKTTTAVGSRTTSTEYDASGRFPTKTTDVEGLATTMQYNVSTGNMLSQTDPYSRTTTYAYDDWNRVIQITNYLNVNTTSTFAKSLFDMVVTETDDEGHQTSTTTNAVGKTTLESTRNVLGQTVQKSYTYDLYDRLVSVSEPFTGAASQWNQTEYDEYARVKRSPILPARSVQLPITACHQP